jgi:hypothetical protein
MSSGGTYCAAPGGVSVRDDRSTLALACRLWQDGAVMDALAGVSGGATMDLAAAGTSAVAMSVLKSTENLVADEMSRLMASIGVGTRVNTSA